MYVATYETSSQIIWNALLHNVLLPPFSYETSMAEERQSQGPVCLAIIWRKLDSKFRWSSV